MAADNSSFLSGISLRKIGMEGSAFAPVGLALGNGNSALEVLVAKSPSEPTLPTLRGAWRSRNGGRAAPLLLVVLYDDKAALCGPTGQDAPAYVNLDPGGGGFHI